MHARTVGRGLALALLAGAVMTGLNGAFAQSGSAATPAAADADKRNVGKKVDAAPSAVLDVVLAQQLFEHGKTANDALSMAAAAKILKSLKGEVKAATGGDGPEREKTEVQEPPAKDSGAAVPDADAMLEAARKAAGQDEALLAVIEETAKTESKGFIPRVEKRTIVEAHQEDPWRWRTARGGELVEIAISGDGDTDLDLFVYDENGNLICSETGPTDDEFCSFVPEWTGEFRMIVVNLGDIHNVYQLWTN
ncbi:hypothetical protein [Sinorhizobium meliloti]|nr:hypothetical protein [Sinorhizobium meliloti]